MKVSVVVSTEFEIDIDNKFKAMDLPDCDDRWDEIPIELAQELVATAQQHVFSGVDPVDEPEISTIYNPDGEVLYRRGDWGVKPQSPGRRLQNCNNFTIDSSLYL